MASDSTDIDARLERELAEGLMSQEQVDEVREQRQLFEAARAEIERDHDGRAAGFVAGVLLVADTVPELIERAKEEHPGRMLYAEPIGYDLFGGRGL